MEDIKEKEEITITKNELQIFLEDWSAGYGSWSDTSRRIVEFLGIDISDGV